MIEAASVLRISRLQLSSADNSGNHLVTSAMRTGGGNGITSVIFNLGLGRSSIAQQAASGG